MRAAVLDYNTHRLMKRDIQEPDAPAGGEVLFRVYEAGVCGTDRELASFRIGFPPDGESFLVLGHEALGQVVETGEGVTGLERGDWVVPMIRRSCQPPCASCARGRRDLCLTSGVRERGIFGMHGYLTEYAVDAAGDVMRIPRELTDRAVLIEPLSVVEKAVATALRMHAGEPRSALVFGAGPIGLLAALVLRERGLDPAVCSLEPPDHPRARLARDAGFEYSNRPGRQADIAIEAAGAPDAALAAIGSLAPLGVCVVLGASTARGEFAFLDLIVGNRTVTGSVNASPEAFARAVEDLARFDPRIVSRMVQRMPFDTFESSILGPSPDVPKLVHVLAEN